VKQRQEKAVDLIGLGFTPAEVKDILGTSPSTMKRDLVALTDRFKSDWGAKKYEAIVEAQIAVFTLMESELVSGSIDASTATAWRGIRDSISDLLGLNAPTKTVNINIDENEALVGYRRFRHSTRYLSNEQLEAVYALIEPMNVPPVRQQIGPPETSPLWAMLERNHW